jgi:phosphatidylserine/phosphatidylglycerophosphate/cardiolipin synthase-like enzyme
MPLADWFLTPVERGNAATQIDAGKAHAEAWTEGNHVEVLIDGASYFARLHESLASLESGDAVHLTDWQGDADERLVGAGTEVGELLADLARRSVDVRGLLWRSHPRQAHFSEQSDFNFVRMVNAAGAEMVLDERVRRGGSHHQKLVILERSGTSGDVAFVGGIDLCHGRHDDQQHLGDAQAVQLDRRYGSQPPWHDVQAEVHGPAVADLAYSFWERWSDDTPLDHRNPLRLLIRRLAGEPRRVSPLNRVRREQNALGSHAIQVLRTYPAKRPPFPFAPAGERSIGRAYQKAFARARCLVYIEDQYLWSRDAASALAAALRRHPELLVVIVVPRYPDRDGRLPGTASRVGREPVLDALQHAGGPRVAVYDLENRDGTPVYVHAKVCIIDDVWMTVGSDNLNRRSWTHDSEISCATIDATADEREPRDPAGLGEGARRLARDTRLRLWREHLGRADSDDADLVDPTRGFAAFRDCAAALERWHQDGGTGARPPGMVRPHRPERVTSWSRRLVKPFYRTILDPDGRPSALKRSGRL